VSLRFVTGLIVLSLVRLAAAERPIVVDSAGAPFTPADLAEEIRVRVPLAGPPLHVRVTAVSGGVRVAAAGGARDVALGDRSGVDAARLVALAASDLLSAEPLVDVAPPAPPRTDSISLAVLASAAGWSSVLGGLAAEVSIPRGPWLLAASLGGGELVRGPIQLADGEVRIGIGRRIGLIDVRVDAIAEPLFVTTGAHDATALVGGGVSVRAHIPLGGPRLVIAGGGDAFATQTEYRTAGMTALTTPRIAPWLRLGLEVSL